MPHAGPPGAAPSSPCDQTPAPHLLLLLSVVAHLPQAQREKAAAAVPGGGGLRPGVLRGKDGQAGGGGGVGG